MFKIKNSEIDFSMEIINKSINPTDIGFYTVHYETQVQFIAGSIRFAKVWGCYHAEIEEFKSGLLVLKNQPQGGTVTWTLVDELCVLSLEKITVPYEAYNFSFKLPASLNSDIYIEGVTILDQSYIQCIIDDLSETLHYA